MFLIFSLWVATLDLDADTLSVELGAAAENSVAAQGKNDLPSLWQSLRAGAGDLFDSFDSATTTDSEVVKIQNKIIDNSDNSSTKIDESSVPPAALPLP